MHPVSVHKHNEMQRCLWQVLYSRKRQAHIRSAQQTTIYGEIIKKWQGDSKVGLHTNRGRIEISLHCASAFKCTFVSLEAAF